MSAAIYLEDTWEACKISFIRGDTVHYSPATGQVTVNKEDRTVITQIHSQGNS